MDPALIAAGVRPTTQNTQPQNFIAAFVPGTGDLANGIGQASNGYPRGGYNDRGAQWGPRLTRLVVRFGTSRILTECASSSQSASLKLPKMASAIRSALQAILMQS